MYEIHTHTHTHTHIQPHKYIVPEYNPLTPSYKNRSRSETAFAFEFMDFENIGNPSQINHFIGGDNDDHTYYQQTHFFKDSNDDRSHSLHGGGHGVGGGSVYSSGGGGVSDRRSHIAGIMYGTGSRAEKEYASYHLSQTQLYNQLIFKHKHHDSSPIVEFKFPAALHTDDEDDDDDDDNDDYGDEDDHGNYNDNYNDNENDNDDEDYDDEYEDNDDDDEENENEDEDHETEYKNKDEMTEYETKKMSVCIEEGDEDEAESDGAAAAEFNQHNVGNETRYYGPYFLFFFFFFVFNVFFFFFFF